MRALVRPLAYQSAFSPIETIVFVCVLATLAYFHILAAVKHSSFFAPSFPATLRPAHARLATGSWVGVSERDWFQAFKHPEDGDRTIELQQIVFSLDDKTRKVSNFNQFLGIPPFCHLCFYISRAVVLFLLAALATCLVRRCRDVSRLPGAHGETRGELGCLEL